MPKCVKFFEVLIGKVPHQGYEDGFQSASSSAYVYAEVPVADNSILSHIGLKINVEALAFQQMACIAVLQGTV